ncbi:MAG: response regulator [Candidatus Omnitrophota bacterium]
MAKRILVADDESDYVRCLEVSLKQAGYAVEIAKNGREAIGAFVRSLKRDEPVSCIILDVKLPDINGVEVLGIIRAVEARWGIYGKFGVSVIMCTAYDKPWMDPDLIKGCDAYVVKSVSDKELLEKIDENLRAKEML